ncbi:MAG: hypothetical protein D3917_08155, partial [Candidatus Electrothrix sp. AX5]|nr:hypothetical protein [Candidatus Electrothrix sp. AX5]
SYYFTFQQVAEDIIAFGRLDVEELESMRKEILVLNQELNNATEAAMTGEQAAEGTAAEQVQQA